jgi:hypothetical protein
MATKRKAWKNGDKFRVTQPYSTYVVDVVYVVNAQNGPTQVCGSTEDGVNIGQWIPISFIKRVENTKDELEEEKANLLGKVAELDAKLKFLADNGLTNYDEQEFKIYQALTVLDETTDKIQRTKKLAALLKDLS